MRSWSSLVPILLVVFGVFGAVHYYLFARLAAQTEISAWITRARWIFLASAVLLPLSMVVGRALSRPTVEVVAYVAFAWMGFVVLLFFGTLGSEIIRLVERGATWTRLVPEDPARRLWLSRVLALGVGAGAAAAAGWGLFSAARPVKVKPVAIPLPRFPEAMNGFKIVQLSDVHIGSTLDGDWLREVVATVNAEEPDLVAITGDLVDGRVSALREHVAPLADLKAKHGVFFVTGNHEYYSGVDEWMDELTRLGIRVLRNEHVLIEDGVARFALAGVDDLKSKSFGGGHGPDLDRALAGCSPDCEVVLLAHQPKQAPLASTKGVGLQLSGHTHGGQIFPWGAFVKLEQGFVAGLDRVGSMLLYTSSGTGYWGPPMRVGSSAEITRIELRRG